ncbi:hypothetical protein [Bacillus suaedae]|uniref:Uncharacterized protein n=1 Tax=Halalkalibacter suaedae TaxID=2822140 RepID=A0A941ATD2_9BACI|nr:hypothetical protein [Bacillus suaedae]MBP3951464.1 hypothetical protein [Bacillus suaedae]
MVEILFDMTALWLSVSLTVLLVAAFTTAMLVTEWDLRAEWQHNNRQQSHMSENKPHLIHHLITWFKPKIPSRSDHCNDDEKPRPFVIQM